MKIRAYHCSLVLFLLASCTKLLEVDSPQNQLTTDKVFADSLTAEAAVVSIYSAINVDIDPQFSINLSLYTDELNYYGPTQQFTDFFTSAVPAENATNLNIWKGYYRQVYQCNHIIEQTAASTLPEPFRLLLTGEAKFLRALAYYQLLSLYGHIPLVLTTEVNANASAGQAPADLVRQQIMTDLKDAVRLLPDTYRGKGRGRATKSAAYALLARACLETGDYPGAIAAASLVIQTGEYTPLPAAEETFTGTSRETILSIATLNGYINAAQSLIADGAPPQYPMTETLLASFESNDRRLANWVARYQEGETQYYYPFKYHNNTDNPSSPENLVILRAAEQYLIRAEAYLQTNNLPAGIEDLNIVRRRAGLSDLPVNLVKSAALEALFRERRHELFTENGSRFIDLKRAGTIDQQLTTVKPEWRPGASVLPIPRNEITYNRNLVQNPGY